LMESIVQPNNINSSIDPYQGITKNQSSLNPQTKKNKKKNRGKKEVEVSMMDVDDETIPDKIDMNDLQDSPSKAFQNTIIMSDHEEQQDALSALEIDNDFEDDFSIDKNPFATQLDHQQNQNANYQYSTNELLRSQLSNQNYYNNYDQQEKRINNSIKKKKKKKKNGDEKPFRVNKNVIPIISTSQRSSNYDNNLDFEEDVDMNSIGEDDDGKPVEATISSPLSLAHLSPIVSSNPFSPSSSTSTITSKRNKGIQTPKSMLFASSNESQSYQQFGYNNNHQYHSPTTMSHLSSPDTRNRRNLIDMGNNEKETEVVDEPMSYDFVELDVHSMQNSVNHNHNHNRNIDHYDIDDSVYQSRPTKFQQLSMMVARSKPEKTISTSPVEFNQYSFKSQSHRLSTASDFVLNELDESQQEIVTNSRQDKQDIRLRSKSSETTTMKIAQNSSHNTASSTSKLRNIHHNLEDTTNSTRNDSMRRKNDTNSAHNLKDERHREMNQVLRDNGKQSDRKYQDRSKSPVKNDQQSYELL
jgi:hypothetical protein